MKIENNKMILIPGWMNSQGMYGENYPILEIWQKRITPKIKIDAAYIIGHSLGCNWTLKNWMQHKNTKLILVNPLVPKRNIRTWFMRWREFKAKEIPPQNKKITNEFKNAWFGIKTCFNLLREDFDRVLNTIPKENILVLCGENDTFYCDQLTKKYLREKGIEFWEIKNAGHDWTSAYDEAIKKILER